MPINKASWPRILSSVREKNTSNPVLYNNLKTLSFVNLSTANEGHELYLKVPSKFHKEYINRNLKSLKHEIDNICNGPVNIELVVDNQSQPVPVFTPPTSVDSTPLFIKPTKKYSQLNPRYTFDSFVVGPNNQIAFEASKIVAQNSGRKNNNPLFIYGPTGLGKTHLLHAIGSYIETYEPHLTVMYITMETFFNECIAKLRTKSMKEFKRKYRDDCNVLLVDDIALLTKGEKVQEEFFYTLDSFLDRNKQIVLVSDRKLEDIKGLEDRVRTRFESGLSVDITMPDLETRIAIAENKAQRDAMLIQKDALEFIARISRTSVRQLEGNLNKVQMYSQLLNEPIDLKLIKKVLGGLQGAEEQLSMSRIQKMVCDTYNIKLCDLKSKSRMKRFIVGRQAAIYLIREYLDESLVEIGRVFGNKDHSTILNAIKKAKERLKKDSEFEKTIEELEDRIKLITD